MLDTLLQNIIIQSAKRDWSYKNACYPVDIWGDSTNHSNIFQPCTPASSQWMNAKCVSLENWD